MKASEQLKERFDELRRSGASMDLGFVAPEGFNDLDLETRAAAILAHMDAKAGQTGPTGGNT